MAARSLPIKEMNDALRKPVDYRHAEGFESPATENIMAMCAMDALAAKAGQPDHSTLTGADAIHAQGNRQVATPQMHAAPVAPRFQ